VFGRGGDPIHRYTMRQAIEERFILDVLKNYTTYATYYKLLKACEEDPNVERKQAARALARFLRLHPHNIAQKTVVMVEHFQAVTRHKIGGRAKAMVVAGSRLEAVRYKLSFDDLILFPRAAYLSSNKPIAPRRFAASISRISKWTGRSS
jgi:type I restriction enzyme R subunit